MEKQELRQAQRAEDPRETAKRRAAEIRGDGINFDDGADEFLTPSPPDGWSYEWKRKSTMNMEDLTHQNHCARTGWVAVPVRRHPEMMQPGANGAIERKGLILMERPAEITEEVKNMEYRKARGAVKQKEDQISSRDEGLLGRSDSKIAPKINKSYEPMAIPDK